MADKVLEQSGLLGKLSLRGDVILTGSYRYDLMQSGDFDLYVVTGGTMKEVAMQILQDLIAQQWWNGHMFYDWVQFSKEHFPHGYYIGLTKYIEGCKWKIDIWVVNQVPEDQLRYVAWLESSLTAERRETILRLKRESYERGRHLSAAQIYEAVLTRKITNLEEV